jgi:hypothetical protein
VYLLPVAYGITRYESFLSSCGLWKTAKNKAMQMKSFPHCRVTSVMPPGADMGILRRRDGEAYQLAATYGLKPEWRDLIALHPNMPGRHSIIGRASHPFHAVR